MRDLYARLMRFDFAARGFHRIADGAATAAGEYLVIALRDIRTERWTGQRVLPTRLADGLTIDRRALCEEDDPCHAYYDVSWGRLAASGGVSPSPSLGDVTRYTRYTVTLALGSVTRTYEAVVLYHDESVGLTAMPEVIDPVIPDLDALAADRAPLAKAPWHSYTKTRRYAAIAQKARDWHANPRARALDVPIGFLVGDDVTRGDETIVAMSSESCTVGCATPKNFRETGRAPVPGSGAIQFNYAWDSSTGPGRLPDLGQCRVGELLENSPNPWPSPPFFPNYPGKPDPIRNDFKNASDGFFSDTHWPNGFVTPYRNATVTVYQRYWYNCPCSGSDVYMGGVFTIERTVAQVGGVWQYTVSKMGLSLTKNIPF